jgi:hypothetical protein
MVDQLIRVGAWGIAGITVTIFLVNALYMFVSPTAWFALPGWLRLQGVLSFERYGKGWGAVQVRALGGIILVTLAWVAFSLLKAK